MADYLITKYEAKADGTSDNRKAIQNAIDDCHQKGGGRVIVPGPGVFVSGGLFLKSGVELHLEHGAVLQASPDVSVHHLLPQLEVNFNAGSAARPQETEARCFIQAIEANDIAFSGRGTIDGNARAYREKDLGPIYRMKANRPRLIMMENCRRITARDITIFDASNWSFHPIGCEDVLIDGIRLLHDLKTPNCDGIDPDHCRNVRIANCHIEAGDDGIVIKNHSHFTQYGDCENITITNCTIVSTSTAIKIGTESHGNFRNIVVSNCIIDRSSRGIGLQLRDWGHIENVLFSNLVIRTRLFDPLWWGRAEPIAITAQPRRPGDRVGHIRGIHFSQIRAEGEAGVMAVCSPESSIEELSFDRVSVTLVKTTKYPAGWKDLRPFQGEEHGGCDPHPVHGFLLENLHDVAIRNCSVVWGENFYDPTAGRPEVWATSMHYENMNPPRVENLTEKTLSPESVR